MYTKFVKKKIESMQLRERINYGYKKVIILMIISGLLSIIAIGMLFASVVNYVGKINASDVAVKMCRVDTVSYTHLDVYKRQHFVSASFRWIL